MARGPDWTNQAEDNAILNNAFAGQLALESWITNNAASLAYMDATQEIDFLSRTIGVGGIYVGLVCGDPSSSPDNLLVKIQDNNGDGIYDETFTSSGILAAALSLGTQLGIDSFRTGTFDNWRVYPTTDSGFGYCFGDGTGVPCPCGQFGAMGAGCANTSGTGAVLSGAGRPVVGSDTFAMTVAGSPPAKPGLSTNSQAPSVTARCAPVPPCDLQWWSPTPIEVGGRSATHQPRA